MNEEWDLSKHEVAENYKEIHQKLVHTTRKWNRAYHEFHLENRNSLKRIGKLETLPKTIFERELEQHIKELKDILNELKRTF